MDIERCCQSVKAIKNIALAQMHFIFGKEATSTDLHKSLEHYKHSLALCNDIDYEMMAKVLSEIGSVYQRLGNYMEAQVHLNNAERSYRGLIDGSATPITDRIQIESTYYTKAKASSDCTKAASESLIKRYESVMNAIGLIHMVINPDGAHMTFAMAINASKEIRGIHPAQARYHKNLARCAIRSSGNYDHAVKLFKMALDLVQSSENKDGLPAQWHLYASIADAQIELDQHEEALDNLKKALEYAKGVCVLKVKNIYVSMAIAHTNLFNLNNNPANLKQCVKAFETAHELVRSVHGPHHKSVLRSHRQLLKAYTIMPGDTEKKEDEVSRHIRAIELGLA